MFTTIKKKTYPHSMSAHTFSFLHTLGREQKRNLSVAELTEEALSNKEGVLSETGALVCQTGRLTGRSPKDRFFVKDDLTADTIWWGNVNQPISTAHFDLVLQKMTAHLQKKSLYVRDAYLGADQDTRIALRVYNTVAWHNLFCHNMFLRVDEKDEKAEHSQFDPQFVIICDPSFESDPNTDGTRSTNFVLVSLSRNMVLIGGTGYAGEMKKSMFTIMNYLLPIQHNILPMHCSANMGTAGDTSIFFGLSGTGKTTLSADPNRRLIGDDEHGWSNTRIFNFEGGCYAKTINLSAENEPQIYAAIRFGAIVENTHFFAGTRKIDYADGSVTENTRTAYPIYHIPNTVQPAIGKCPTDIFFLTADASGVLPPISKLDVQQAMYHFISGYTAKVAGTEAGVTEPEIVFSACFGAPFLPLHPIHYAQMLGEKLAENRVQVWLVNTGWNKGPYGVGTRISLPHTRTLIGCVLEGKLQAVTYVQEEMFGLHMPTTCPGIPAGILNPRDGWEDKAAYTEKAKQLASAFHKNFEKYRNKADESILAGAPLV